jgi:hypothetical protein
MENLLNVFIFCDGRAGNLGTQAPAAPGCHGFEHANEYFMAHSDNRGCVVFMMRFFLGFCLVVCCTTVLVITFFCLRFGFFFFVDVVVVIRFGIFNYIEGS